VDKTACTGHFSLLWCESTACLHDQYFANNHQQPSQLTTEMAFPCKKKKQPTKGQPVQRPLLTHLPKRPEPLFRLPGLLTEHQASLHRASHGHKQAAGAGKAISPEHLTTDVPSALLSCKDTRRKASAPPSNNWKQLQKILHSKPVPADTQRSPSKFTRAYAVAFAGTRCLCAAGS